MSAKPSHSNSNMSTEAKTSKKTATKKVVEPVAAAATPSPAPAAEPKAKATRKASAKTEVVVPTVETVATPTATETAVAAPSSSIGSVVEKLRDVRSRFSNELKEIIAETLLAAKTAAREVKDAKRKRRVKKDVSEMTAEERTAWEARLS